MATNKIRANAGPEDWVSLPVVPTLFDTAESHSVAGSGVQEAQEVTVAGQRAVSNSSVETEMATSRLTEMARTVGRLRSLGCAEYGGQHA